MRLKKQTDYSLRVLMYLGGKGVDFSTIKEMAQIFEISQNHLMKVVQQLHQVGYVGTLRGKNGGVWLEKDPKEIVIGDVLRVTNEDNELAECFIQANKCNISPQCKLKHVFTEANQAFFKVLDSYTLADMIGSPDIFQGVIDFESPSSVTLQ